MVDREKEIFDSIAKELRNKYKTIYIIRKHLSSVPAIFPAVTIIQENNIVNKKYSTFTKLENVSISTFYIEIYSNDEELKEEICKNISMLIDDVLSKFNYLRKLNQPLSNADDSIARRVMRYTRENLI